MVQKETHRKDYDGPQKYFWASPSNKVQTYKDQQLRGVIKIVSVHLIRVSVLKLLFSAAARFCSL